MLIVGFCLFPASIPTFGLVPSALGRFLCVSVCPPLIILTLFHRFRLAPTT
ncbi:hypothetical protein BDN72DRAFT_169774 [Pluteus cervinus]|uniref:Uncharacterized protein n=1 Tax=Pluteus cervinus TaxID=181527 RepID=A0ACD3AJZ7_9AGAR|nr:hypothetical protein BDN72DRAFT_169774 [Pluteus cervinus]